MTRTGKARSVADSQLGATDAATAATDAVTAATVLVNDPDGGSTATGSRDLAASWESDAVRP